MHRFLVGVADVSMGVKFLSGPIYFYLSTSTPFSDPPLPLAECALFFLHLTWKVQSSTF